ncbi:unnamed protein product [Hapterophycus canaliculatus]
MTPGCYTLASKVERMMCIRLKRILLEEVRELDAEVELARAMAVKCARKSVAAQESKQKMDEIDLAL